ncbi:MAG: dephospho-CoA kinase [Candidatus Dadabacteria bacterium]|nr:MAG: dephospho-CoA kinase [Candidatus Dadabacteria bacterium]
MSKIVAITGNIGSGKSTVARLLGRRGAVVIDADQLARDVVAPGTPGAAAIRDAFGDEVFDVHGELDRKALGAVVFADPDARRRLEQITHPAIRAEMMQRIARAQRQAPPLIVLEVPLLFEGGMDRMFPDVLLVAADDDVRRQRIAARDSLPAAEIDNRMRSQMPQQEKLERARWVIWNNGGLDALEAAVERLWPELTGAVNQV